MSIFLAKRIMAIINIPKEQYPVLRRLSELSEPHFSELLNGLNEIEASLNTAEFSKHLSEKVKSISEDELDDFVVMLCGLYPAKENNNKTSSQIAFDIRQTIVEEKPALFPLEKANILEARMNKLLSVDKAIAITAKAFDVATEHQNVFCASRIFSDIRPVFSASASSVEAAVVVHTLNISYHEGRDHKELFVAMETSEMEQLKKTIERAEKKGQALQKMIKTTGVTYLE